MEWIVARVPWAPDVSSWADVDEDFRLDDIDLSLLSELIDDVLLAAISEAHHEARRNAPRDQFWCCSTSDGTFHGWAFEWTIRENEASISDETAYELRRDSREAAIAHDGD